MLKSHEKFSLVDVNLAPTDVFLEVNWDPTNETTNDCKILKMTLPGGKVHYIDRKILLEILFYIGKAEDQQKMIPQTMETIHHYKTVLGIKATKDIGKGEMINFPVELSVPCAALNQDVIGEVPKGAKVMNKDGTLWKR